MVPKEVQQEFEYALDYFIDDWKGEIRDHLANEQGAPDSKVTNSAESAIMSGMRVIKGEESPSGLRSYWLLSEGQILKSIVARTDEEADKLLN